MAPATSCSMRLPCALACSACCATGTTPWACSATWVRRPARSCTAWPAARTSRHGPLAACSHWVDVACSGVTVSLRRCVAACKACRTCASRTGAVVGVAQSAAGEGAVAGAGACAAVGAWARPASAWRRRCCRCSASNATPQPSPSRASTAVASHHSWRLPTLSSAACTVRPRRGPSCSSAWCATCRVCNCGASAARVWASACADATATCSASTALRAGLLSWAVAVPGAASARSVCACSVSSARTSSCTASGRTPCGCSTACRAQRMRSTAALAWAAVTPSASVALGGNAAAHACACCAQVGVKSHNRCALAVARCTSAWPCCRVWPCAATLCASGARSAAAPSFQPVCPSRQPQPAVPAASNTASASPIHRPRCSVCSGQLPSTGTGSTGVSSTGGSCGGTGAAAGSATDHAGSA